MEAFTDPKVWYGLFFAFLYQVAATAMASFIGPTINGTSLRELSIYGLLILTSGLTGSGFGNFETSLLNYPLGITNILGLMFARKLILCLPTHAASYNLSVPFRPSLVQSLYIHCLITSGLVASLHFIAAFSTYLPSLYISHSPPGTLPATLKERRRTLYCPLAIRWDLSLVPNSSLPAKLHDSKRDSRL